MSAGQTFTGSYFVSDEDDNITAFELKVCIAVHCASIFNTDKCRMSSL